MRTRWDYNEETGEEKEVEIPTFSEHWPEAVMNDLENANWHSQYEVFDSLVKVLPEAYASLKGNGDYDTAEELKRAVEIWENHF